MLNNGSMMDGRREGGGGVLELLRAGDNIHLELSREMKVRGTCQGVTHTWITAGFVRMKAITREKEADEKGKRIKSRIWDFS